MGYASRANSTAQHFASPEGVAEARVNRAAWLEATAQAAADKRQREWDALVAAVNADDAVKRFGPVRLALAQAHIAKGQPRG